MLGKATFKMCFFEIYFPENVKDYDLGALGPNLVTRLLMISGSK